MRSSLPFPPAIVAHREAPVGAAHIDPLHQMDERSIFDPELWLGTVGHMRKWMRKIQVQKELSNRR